ncbi:spectrin beta chain, non-erythrocytic 2-like [Peromyscus leucopus]|uniref:spectrin beta chain, non-erythrocytic 2-like n=1 Tax=Peromyscus leucopus TaxID=10041 RepID=UPI001884A3F5|nr:spectrin beta chain, non-erythrocytic 2-like [Peromyscus leucopus]
MAGRPEGSLVDGQTAPDTAWDGTQSQLPPSTQAPSINGVCTDTESSQPLFEQQRLEQSSVSEGPVSLSGGVDLVHCEAHRCQ